MLHDSESFLRLYAETARECAIAGFECSIRHLVVDDSAGTDGDVQRLESLERVEVLTPPFNLGHQRAIVFGLRFLAPLLDGNSLVVTMDSDGEDRPSDVPRLIAALNDSTVSLALAQRTKRSESLRFRTMYIVFRLMFRLLTGTTVQSGNFAVQRADSLVATIHHPNFDFCYSSTLLALSRPTVSVPCARGERFAGRSRMNTHSLIAHGIRMLLPFSERIAVRMLFVALTSSAALLPFLLLVGVGMFGDSPGPAIFSVLAALAVVFVLSFAAFVILFSGFSQASAVAMKGIGVPLPPISLKEDNR
jgi:polyisoprenyl-phosphate glycosyltransferase